MKALGVQTVELLIINPGWYGLTHVNRCLKGIVMFDCTKELF
jgi:hypothetical protein